MSLLPATRAFVLLLALGLGGLVAPAAHAWSHLGELEHIETPAEVPALQALGDPEPPHDCRLCEVRFAAAEPAVRVVHASAHAAEVPSVALTAPDLSAPPLFFGRAPPARG